MKDFPYKRNDYTDSDIKKMFKALQKEDTKKRIQLDIPFKIRNVVFDPYTFLFRYTFFSYEDENYEKFNILSDMFNEENRMKCKKLTAKYSPYDFFINNKEKIEEECLKTYGKITNQNMRETIWSMVKECESFKPLNLKIIIDLFKVKSILDFSSGWGDRLITAMACDVEYTGIDANKNLFPNYQEMISFFKKSPEKYVMINGRAEDVEIPDRDYDLVFTSPPYFDLEIYTNNKNQSISKYNQENVWFENFLKIAIERCLEKLQDKGHLVLVINQKSYKERYVTKMIHFINNLTDMHFLGVIGYNINNTQPIWVWKKSKELPKELYENDYELLKTERLQVRVFRSSDRNDLSKLFKKPENMKNIFNGKIKTKKETEEQLIKYIKNQYTMYPVILDNKIIGIIGYYDGKYLKHSKLYGKLLLRIMIDEEHRGKGYGYESLFDFVKYLREKLKFQNIYSLIKKENTASISLHKKLDFKIVDSFKFHGLDHVLMY
jgi:RimJ/RimL family protein N-acetyltransferase/16S rRNA G966 N2-methylase RsmD